eukprot:g2606.t1
MSDRIEEAYCKCKKDNPQGGRHRYLQEDKSEWTMYTFFEKKPYVPVILMVVVLVISAVWVLLLSRFAKPITILNCLFQIGVIGGVGGLLQFKYKVDLGAPLIGIAVILFIYMVARFKVLLNAGNFMQQASKALQKNASIFPVLLPLQLFYTIFLFLLYEMWLGVFAKRKVELSFGRCLIKTDIESNFNLAQFTTTTLLWLTFFINHVKCHVVAMTIGTWCFQQKVEGNKPARALAIALTKSSPVLGCSSLIVALTEELRNIASNKCNLFNPFMFTLFIFAWFVSKCVEAFGRFAVIFHAITGDSFCKSSYRSFKMLKTHLEGALVTSFAGESVITFGAYFFSIAMGFGAWAWFDQEMDYETLNPKSWAKHSEALFWVFLFIFFLLNKYPMFTIWIINIIASIDWFKGEIAGPLTALSEGSHTSHSDPDVKKVYYLLEAPPEEGGIAMGAKTDTAVPNNPGQAQ